MSCMSSKLLIRVILLAKVNEDGTQHYLVFQPLNKYFKLITNTLSILSWQSKGLFTENIDPTTTSLSPLFN